MQEQALDTKKVAMDSSGFWRRFNLILWPLVAIGFVGILSKSFAVDFPESSLGSILFNLLSWVGNIVLLIGSPITLGYFAYRIGGSLWYLLVGIFGIGGLITWPTFLIGYLIVLVLHKKKTNRGFLVAALVALAILASQLY